MATLLSAADIQAAVPDDAVLRLWDRDGDGVPDPAWIGLCVTNADSYVRMRLRAAFPAGPDAAGGTVDPAIVAHAVMVACWFAVVFNPLMSAADTAPYVAAKTAADEFFARLNKDAQNRAVTSTMGRAQPYGAVDNQVSTGVSTASPPALDNPLAVNPSVGTPTDPYGRNADLEDSGGF